MGSAFTSLAAVAIGAQSVTEVISPSSSGEDITAGGTIRRMVGQVTVWPGAINQDVYWRFGIITLNEDAGDALVIPEPYADPASWMYERSSWTSTSSIQDSAQFQRFEFDTAVMRKMPQLERSLIGIMENLAGSGTTVNYFLAIKVLVHVP